MMPTRFDTTEKWWKEPLNAGAHDSLIDIRWGSANQAEVTWQLRHALLVRQLQARCGGVHQASSAGSLAAESAAIMLWPSF